MLRAEVGIHYASLTTSPRTNRDLGVGYVTSKLAGADYYLFFAGCMFVTAVLFIFVALRYRVRRFVQGAEGDLEAAEPTAA